MILGLTGRKRSGKSTAARYLVDNHGFVEISFAGPLKRMALAINPVIGWNWDPVHEDGGEVYLADVVECFGWEYAKDQFPEARRFLQRLGTEGVRGHIGEDTWIDLVELEIQRTWGIVPYGFIPGDKPYPPIVVSDVRFENEATLVREWGGEVVEIRRPSARDFVANEHASEHRVRADRTVTNIDGEPEIAFDLLSAIVADIGDE